MAKRPGHIQAMDVLAPRRHWTLVDVLHDFGEGEAVLALGRWDGEKRLAIRWNGTVKKPIGNPQSRGKGTWFVVPNNLCAGILKSESIPQSAKARAARFFWNRAR